MKKSRVFSLFMGLVLICCLSATVVLGAQMPEADTNTSDAAMGSSFGLDATHALLGSTELVKNATSVFLYEYASQTLMYAWNADAPLDPASMVKIMTALVAIENGTLSDVVIVKEDVLATVPYDAVSADLKPDELITLEELLYCMMVGSANDAAAVIADHVGGSISGFVGMMNARAAELGCKDTNFTNAHGIHEDQQYTTARDMGRILSAAIQNDTFSTIFGAVTHQVPATNKAEARDLSSGNFLMNTDETPLYYDERVIGGRTGVAGDGTRCLAAVAQKDGMSLVSIVMGAESVYEEDGYKVRSFGSFKETSSLFSAGFDGYKISQILYPGQALIQMPVQNGTSQVILGPSDSASAVLPAGTSLDDLTFHYDDEAYKLTAPVEKGDVVSSLEIWNGNTCIAKSELCALNSVPVYSEPDTSKSENDKPIQTVLTVTLVIAIVCIPIFLTVRFSAKIRRLFRLRRSRRHRRDRRRSR